MNRLFRLPDLPELRPPFVLPEPAPPLPVRPSLDPYAPPSMRPVYVRLDELAFNLRALTYSEMTELADATGSDPRKLLAWAKGRP